MEPSPKRPRLSIFHRQPTDDELDKARYDNDMTLKSRFESIFAKYSQDFSGIGDEIDLATGEVVVNNGHLESIEDETDLGLENRSGGFTTAGRSILRAMTVALDPSLSGPDDVLASIESIAENAAISDDASTGESGDDLFETPTREESMPDYSDQDLQRTSENPDMEPYNSESDSLFEENTRRSTSVDSLFGNTSESGAHISHTFYDSTISTEPSLPPLNHMANDKEILDRFGPNLGKEMLDVITQRKDAHIEPMWRIPVQIQAPRQHRQTPISHASSPISMSPKNKNSRSLWYASAVAARRARSEEQSPPPERAESVDPLQEDFSSDLEHHSSPKPQSADPPDQSGSEFEVDYDAIEGGPIEGGPIEDLLEKIRATGDCPYCYGKFRNKSGVMAHWDRLLKRPPKNIHDDDPHDAKVMKKIRSTAVARVRLPRLIVYDFRTMVELHEGAGMTFADIAASKTLRTRKRGLQLQDIYNKHRTPRNARETPAPTRKWSPSEEQQLQTLCQNPLSTITTLRRGLRGRNELEIGNHLAEVWLSQLGSNQAVTGLEQRQESAMHLSDNNVLPSREEEHDVQVKYEDSEDDLFDMV